MRPTTLTLFISAILIAAGLAQSARAVDDPVTPYSGQDWFAECTPVNICPNRKCTPIGSRCTFCERPKTTGACTFAWDSSCGYFYEIPAGPGPGAQGLHVKGHCGKKYRGLCFRGGCQGGQDDGLAIGICAASYCEGS